ncbi:hypothetical protein SLS61_001312 [Didymella pomorum]
MTARERESRKRKNRSSDEGYFSASRSSSDETTFSTFDPEIESGFAFMQLGKAYNIDTSTYEATESQGKEFSYYYWKYAGYILRAVVDIEDHGPFDESRGYLEGQRGMELDLTKRRADFKIADTLDELGPNFQWSI